MQISEQHSLVVLLPQEMVIWWCGAQQRTDCVYVVGLRCAVPPLQAGACWMTAAAGRRWR